MRSPMVLLAAAAVLFPALSGCSDDPEPCVDCNGAYANALTHPDSLINDLMESYRRREIEPYANLLATDFLFHFLPEDAGDVPDGAWDRDQDIAATQRLFEEPSVTRITIDLQWFPPVADTLRGMAVQRVEVTFVDLKVDIDGGNTTLQINGDRQRFAFVPGRESLGEDPARLYLLDWVDLGNSSFRTAAAVEPTTWGSIKNRFD